MSSRVNGEDRAAEREAREMAAFLRSMPAPTVVTSVTSLPVLADVGRRPTGLHLPGHVQGQVEKAPALLLIPMNDRELAGPPWMVLLPVTEDGECRPGVFLEIMSGSAEAAVGLWDRHRAELGGE